MKRLGKESVKNPQPEAPSAAKTSPATSRSVASSSPANARTPLIAVILVMLVMLVIIIPIQLHTINLDMPLPSTTPPTQDPVVHVVVIDFEGTVYSDNDAMPNLPVSQQPELHIKPNKLVDYGVVASVLASAQRSTLKKMGAAGSEQYVK